jgi:hypothetical protein
MPFVGPWGTFIHIPKTGGQWMRHVLRSNFDLEKNSYRNVKYTHTLPEDKAEGTWWTVVRHPAEWLRSFWAHRYHECYAVGHFQLRPIDSSAWNTFNVRTVGLLDWDFERFARRMATKEPGLISWFFFYFLAPRVQAIRLEDVDDFLFRNFGIAELPKKANTGYGKLGDKWPEEITEEIRYLIKEAEPLLYDTFKWEA